MFARSIISPLVPPQFADAFWLSRPGSRISDETMHELLAELRRRKDAKENLCELCMGTGWSQDNCCESCLGQGLFLTRREYDQLRNLIEVTPLKDLEG